MSLEEIDITCPHCQRPYRLKVDLGVLARVRKQAVCFRCQTTFDVLSRIAARSDGENSSKSLPTRDLKLPRPAVERARSQGKDKGKGKGKTEEAATRATVSGIGPPKLPALAESKSTALPPLVKAPDPQPVVPLAPLQFDLPTLPERSWLDEAEPSLDELSTRFRPVTPSLGALLGESD